MPLSRQEQRALIEIERALLVDDPAFAARIESWPARSRRRVAFASLAVASGSVLLTIGLFGGDPVHVVLGVVGLVVAVVGAAAIVATYSAPFAAVRRWMRRFGRRRRPG